jgi:hypothetical protein
MTNKLTSQGTLLAIQPRIRLTRSFDERSHSYLGYALRIQGTIADEERDFSIGIGQAAQAKHKFQAGDVLSGRAEPVVDPKLESVEFYKASGLKVIERAGTQKSSPPPFVGVPPELPVYRDRGHRRLDSKAYAARCSTCIWGCHMPVEMIIDQWNPSQKKYRFETFCYGPKSCSLYRPGTTRKVPGRKGMSWEEADWIDEEATALRGDDE